MTPGRETLFLLFLPATPSSPSRTLEGLFELTRCPSRALDSLLALLPELQRYKDTVKCAALGTEAPGHSQQQLTQTLIVRLLKTHYFTLMIVESRQNRIELVTRPARQPPPMRKTPSTGRSPDSCSTYRLPEPRRHPQATWRLSERPPLPRWQQPVTTSPRTSVLNP